jgi:hypothetical protein
MVTSAVLIRGYAEHLLQYDPFEHPVTLQLGGSDPQELAAAVQLGWQTFLTQVRQLAIDQKINLPKVFVSYAWKGEEIATNKRGGKG